MDEQNLNLGSDTTGEDVAGRNEEPEVQGHMIAGDIAGVAGDVAGRNVAGDVAGDVAGRNIAGDVAGDVAG